MSDSAHLTPVFLSKHDFLDANSDTLLGPAGSSVS